MIAVFGVFNSSCTTGMLLTTMYSFSEERKHQQKKRDELSGILHAVNGITNITSGLISVCMHRWMWESLSTFQTAKKSLSIQTMNNLLIIIADTKVVVYFCLYVSLHHWTGSLTEIPSSQLSMYASSYYGNLHTTLLHRNHDKCQLACWKTALQGYAPCSWVR